MKNRKRNFVILISVLIALLLIFIFGNSLESIPQSQEKSTRVTEIITPVLELFIGKGNVTHYLVRKLAHFTEFSVLGALLTLLFVLYKLRGWTLCVNCLFLSLLTAVIDETIQYYSNRGSQVQDVILDFFGSIVGISLVLLMTGLVTRYRMNKNACDL